MRSIVAILGLLVLSLTPADAVAQTLVGRLVDAETAAPVANATITALDEANSAIAGVLTNAEGSFRITLERSARIRLRAERIGYETATTDLLEVEGGATLEVEFRLSTSAVVLSPITVTVAPRPWWESERPPQVWGFYERMDRYGRTGMGRFLTAEDLALQKGAPGWTILSNQLAFGIRAEMPSRGPTTPSVTIRGPLGTRCTPVYFVDRLRYGADEWAIYSLIESMNEQGRIEGIETFSPWYIPSELAVQLRHGEDCVVVIWTREPPSTR